ncbi:MAG: anion transporter [Chloroflexi bacterium]|nr:anion transporter [Chloroflexota bacterium]
MVLGRLPGFGLDRAGVALVGAIALLAFGELTLSEAVDAVDASTLVLLFGLMLVSAQLRLGGFYSELTRRVAGANVSPDVLLALVIVTAGVLSAVLVNDIAVFAMTPLLLEICTRRGLYPMPFLLALAGAANVGSAATLIGNPQNVLIGQTLNLSFGRFLLDAGVPALLGLAAVWWIVRWRTKGRWYRQLPLVQVEAPPFDRWHTAKGLVVLGVLIAAFLIGTWPRELLALGAGGALLLVNRRAASPRILANVDWPLLVLFTGLFVVNGAVLRLGAFQLAAQDLNRAGIDLEQPGILFGITVVLSNLVSNVPAVMLLLPFAEHPFSGPVLALASTLAGNLFIVGSIANIIVVEQAGRWGFRITWWEHARVGVPVTLVTLLIAAGWLWIRAAWS